MSKYAFYILILLSTWMSFAFTCKSVFKDPELAVLMTGQLIKSDSPNITRKLFRILAQFRMYFEVKVPGASFPAYVEKIGRVYVTFRTPYTTKRFKLSDIICISPIAADHNAEPPEFLRVAPKTRDRVELLKISQINAQQGIFVRVITKDGKQFDVKTSLVDPRNLTVYLFNKRGLTKLHISDIKSLKYSKHEYKPHRNIYQQPIPTRANIVSLPSISYFRAQMTEITGSSRRKVGTLIELLMSLNEKWGLLYLHWLNRMNIRGLQLLAAYSDYANNDIRTLIDAITRNDSRLVTEVNLRMPPHYPFIAVERQENPQ